MGSSPSSSSSSSSSSLRNDIADVESLQLDLETIETTTNKFSESNKLGQGGFGEVFKGTLGVNGQEIAVKRLSKSSVLLGC
ncbi:hypothetical protein PS2_000997 [Malus domestica]